MLENWGSYFLSDIKNIENIYLQANGITLNYVLWMESLSKCNPDFSRPGNLFTSKCNIPFFLFCGWELS